LSENIADNGGLASAFRGYQTWLRDHSVDTSLLPGLTSISHNQLFFIGFARAYCSNAKQKALDLSLMVDPHSPNHVRVNTAVGNFPEFSKAFSCHKNALLNLPSSKRCSLW
jgi:predicted metalloendopeptidase